MDEVTVETTLNQAELNQFQIPIEDRRAVKDAAQRFALSERLRIDKVSQALLDAKRLFGEYSSIEVSELSINIIDGKIGEGTAREKTVEVQIPSQNQVVTEIKTSLATVLGSLPENEIDGVCGEIGLALSASTILHEGVHGLLNSKPDSAFAQNFETASGMNNQNGRLSTLLDEGITYAIQAIYAPEAKPLGSLAPTVKETDNSEVKLRKYLGERLRPKVETYLGQGRPIDSEFFQFASLEMKNLGVENA